MSSSSSSPEAYHPQLDHTGLHGSPSHGNHQVTSHVPASIITYVLNDTRVYVAVAETYDKAIDLAYEAFPSELSVLDGNNNNNKESRTIPHTQIQLTLNAHIKHQPTHITISRSAWPTIAANLHEYEIVHIHILDKPLVPHSPKPKSKPPMKTIEGGVVVAAAGGEHSEEEMLPPAYSSSSAHLAKYLAPDQVATPHSHPHSHSGSRTPSPTLGERVKDWFKGDSSPSVE
ncbi:hypothetical protein BC835DRAFT_1420788 [Cytidiella melzeri]|nr:hypothetical protein BC835DRAFT_1420788 [Cytidiella melzeri]